MTTGSIIIAVILLLAGLVWMLLPFLRSEQVNSSAKANAKQRDRLLYYYEQVMATVRDLDEDFSTGKINEDEYQADRESWMERGVKILAALNETADSVPAATKAEVKSANASQRVALDDDIDAAIEAAVARALKA